VAVELYCHSTLALQKLKLVNFVSVQFDGWFVQVTHQWCQATPGTVRSQSPFQPTADGTRGELRLAEALEVPNAMVNDVDAGHEERQPVAIKLHISVVYGGGRPLLDRSPRGGGG